MTHSSTAVRGGGGRNVAVSSAPTSSADDDIGGLEGRSSQAPNYDDDDIGGLEFASTQRKLHGGTRQVRGAVYATDVEQNVPQVGSGGVRGRGNGGGGKNQLDKQHGQHDTQDATTPQVAQLFAHAAATGAWGKPS